MNPIDTYKKEFGRGYIDENGIYFDNIQDFLYQSILGFCEGRRNENEIVLNTIYDKNIMKN